MQNKIQHKALPLDLQERG